MKRVLILTDSTADLSVDLREERQIYSLPLLVQFGDEHYRDGIDLTTKELYDIVDVRKELPKTAAIPPGQFIDFFEQYLNQGYEIVYVGIGSTISGTFQSAMIAKQMIETKDVYLIDSKNLSSGIGLLALKAADFRDQGLSAMQIKEALEKLVPCVKSQFAIKTLDYLHKGGRASGTAKLIGDVLGIKPIIQVKDGVLIVYKKPVGKMTRALDMMLSDFFKELDHDNLDLDYVMVTHSLADKNAAYMIEKIKSKVLPKQLLESHAGCVISSHCGPGTIGILYMTRSAS